MSEVLLISPVEHQLAKLMAEYGPKWGFAVPTSVQAMAQATPQDPVDAEPLGETAEGETPEVADFILNGWNYEIDLGEEGASKLRAALAEYVERTKVSPGRARHRDRSSPVSVEAADADTDDVINVAGHRLSAGSIEEVLAAHPDVAECAVFGISDPKKGQIPRGLIVLKSGVPNDYESEKRLCLELVRMVREQIGAGAALKEVSVVAALPKTRSGKILRKTMGNIADGQSIVAPSTIDDASVLDALRAALRPEQPSGQQDDHGAALPTMESRPRV